MKSYLTDNAPIPLGHYSQAVSDGHVLFLSTQLPLVPGEKPDPAASPSEQMKQVLRNIFAVLDEAGLTPDSLLRVSLYLADIDAWEEVNDAYASVMGECKPARGVIQVAGLHKGFLVAADAVASAR